jgi:hypothetical protein
MYYAPKSLTDTPPTTDELRSALVRRRWSAIVGIGSCLVPAPGATAIIAGAWLLHMRNKTPRKDEAFSITEFNLRKVTVPTLVIAGAAEAALGVATVLTAGAAAPLWFIAHCGVHVVLGAMAGGIWKHNNDIINAATRPAGYKGDPKMLDVLPRVRDVSRRRGGGIQAP